MNHINVHEWTINKTIYDPFMNIRVIGWWWMTISKALSLQYLSEILVGMGLVVSKVNEAQALVS